MISLPDASGLMDDFLLYVEKCERPKRKEELRSIQNSWTFVVQSGVKVPPGLASMMSQVLYFLELEMECLNEAEQVLKKCAPVITDAVATCVWVREKLGKMESSGEVITRRAYEGLHGTDTQDNLSICESEGDSVYRLAQDGYVLMNQVLGK